MRIRRILGKHGRTTIPFPIRSLLNLSENDVLSFELSEDDSAVVIRREKICDGCADACEEITSKDVIEFINMLPLDLQRSIYGNLNRKLGHPRRKVERVTL